MGWLSMTHCCIKSATLFNQCSITSTATLLGRETRPIDAVFFITDGIVRTYTSNNGEGSDSQHAEDLEKISALEENFLNWF